MTAVRQIRGSDLTLGEAVTSGLVPELPLLDWNAWQRWRSNEGLRPTRADAGGVPSSGQEAALWRTAMEHYHGADWMVKQALAPLPQVEAAKAPPPSAPRLASSPAAGAVDPAAAETQAPATPPRVSPGSGVPTGAARSPGSGAASPGQSWHDSNPGTPVSLTRKIFTSYNPQKEVLEVYLERLRKQAQALEILGQPLGAGIVETLQATAPFSLRISEECPGDSVEAVKLLKREYAFEMLEIDGTEQQAYRIRALEGMLEDRQVSVDDLKVRLASGATLQTPSPVQATRSSEPGLASSPAADAGAPERPAAAAQPEEFRLFWTGAASYAPSSGRHSTCGRPRGTVATGES